MSTDYNTLQGKGINYLPAEYLAKVQAAKKNQNNSLNNIPDGKAVNYLPAEYLAKVRAANNTNFDTVEFNYAQPVQEAPQTKKKSNTGKIIGTLAAITAIIVAVKNRKNIGKAVKKLFKNGADDIGSKVVKEVGEEVSE